MQESAGSMGVFGIIIYLVLVVLMIVSYWKIFTKAGKPGWAIFIPIYNIIVILEVINRPIWWILLFFVPVVNFVVLIIMCLDLAKSFGKDTLFGVLTIFFPIICLPILGLGSAQYSKISR
ncbi:MAG: signal peptidase I [Spirochaetes bacterium]|nr:signal peptidase I [Spirochaetota bacterium]MBN2771800.1 signal peptidase I [Spirochaetota bacterium]